MFEQPYYHGILRKTIVSFGTLFSNLKIARQNKTTGLIEQTIAVPIAYGPKEKEIVRTDSDPNLTNHTYTSLPRLSFEILGYGYDAARKVNRLSKLTCQ